MKGTWIIVEQAAGLGGGGRQWRMLGSQESPKVPGARAQGNASKTNSEGGKCCPSPTLLNYIHTHTRDQGSATHSNKQRVTRAREPAWRPDALAGSVTQAVRTSRAPGTMPPPFPLQDRHMPHKQTSKAANGLWFIFLFFHMNSKGWSGPILAPFALNVP